jgi:hypothetical protein
MSYGNAIFSFVRNCHILFHRICTFHIYPPVRNKGYNFSKFYALFSQTVYSKRCYSVSPVLLIWLFLMITDAQHILYDYCPIVCLLWEVCSSVLLIFECFFFLFLLSFTSSSHTLDIHPLSDVCLPLCDCLLTLMVLSFSGQLKFWKPIFLIYLILLVS